MGLGSQFLKWFGIVSVLLILVVYFKGSTALGGSIAQMIQTISYAWTGRNAEGNFAAYPTGG